MTIKEFCALEIGDIVRYNGAHGQRNFVVFTTAQQYAFNQYVIEGIWESPASDKCHPFKSSIVVLLTLVKLAVKKTRLQRIAENLAS